MFWFEMGKNIQNVWLSHGHVEPPPRRSASLPFRNLLGGPWLSCWARRSPSWPSGKMYVMVKLQGVHRLNNFSFFKWRIKSVQTGQKTSEKVVNLELKMPSWIRIYPKKFPSSVASASSSLMTQLKRSLHPGLWCWTRTWDFGQS